MSIIETIQAAIEKHGLLKPGETVVVGVSGGSDSVALLHAFHKLEIPCTVAHLNHQLRGDESDADEQFVRELADELGVPFVVKSVDVRQIAETNGVSIEMAARQARHDFFSEFDDAVVALAHHADDQAETFILKLARGAGTEGLGGMPFVQQIGSIRLIRPMLEIPRSEIVAWLEQNGFPWREDASNIDETYLRNRVRHTIIPLLEKELNPNIRDTILRTMDILRAENEWMDSLVEEASCLAARRRRLRKWLFDQGAEHADFDAVEKILSLMDAGNGTTIFELNDRQRVVIEYGQPRFEQAPFQIRATHWKLTTESGTGWRRDHGRGAGILPAEASFSADKIGKSPIEVRGYEPGDRIAPLGMEGSRKLQDILTDQKVPQFQRSRIPVVVCRGEIIWIPGYRIARGWEVPTADAPSIHVRLDLA